MAIGVSARDELNRPATIERLTALIANDLQQVNALILERMQSPVALIPQLAGHIIAAGGKPSRAWGPGSIDKPSCGHPIGQVANRRKGERIRQNTKTPR